MNVKDIPTVKLTKPRDNLAGTVARCINYISKHNNDQIDVVLMAGTMTCLIVRCHLKISLSPLMNILHRLKAYPMSTKYLFVKYLQDVISTL